MSFVEIRQNLKDRYWRLPKQDIDWLLEWAWPELEITISTLGDYKRACTMYEEIEKGVAKDDWRSPAALRLLRLGSEIVRFETEYEGEYGFSPGLRRWGAPKKLPVRDDDHRAFFAIMGHLVALGCLLDTGERQRTRRGKSDIVYVLRRSNLH
jgi:hypothetical protein